MRGYNDDIHKPDGPAQVGKPDCHTGRLPGPGVAVLLLPKGFSDDLSKIGQGLPVVVLMHDKNSVKSLALMELLNKIRSDYAGKIEFLAVDIDSQEGQVFSRRQAVGAITLLLFDAHGVRRAVLDQSADENLLRSVLDGL